MRLPSSSAANGVTAPRVAERPTSSLRLRVISAVVMAAIVFAALAAGPRGFAILVIIAAAILGWEWSRLCDDGHFELAGVAVAGGAALAASLALVSGPSAGVVASLVSAPVAYAAAWATGRGRAALWLAAGALYAGLPAVALVWVRGDSKAGLVALLWLLLAVWATDIGAYFAGRLIGGPKLAPRISPKKTWAGLLGGMASAALVGVLFAEFYPGAPEAMRLALAGAILAVVAQAGDFLESAVKRRFDAKDSSNLIPGHGGLMDRVDGLLAAASVLALGQWLSGGDVLAWQ
jgi:phosphatidate cytidylyltransferase